MSIGAAERARLLYPSSPGFQTAYLKGVTAAQSGRNASACPYGRGWKVWKLAWLRGYDSIATPNDEEE